jgi:quercetin dioxygenase-like cupin family protein
MSLHEQQPPTPTPIAGVAHVTLAGQAEGLRNLSLWRQSMAPGGCTPPHSHACEEIVLCDAGRGEVHIAGEVHPFRAGQTLVLLPGVPHQIFNTGEEPLVTTAVFSATPVPVTLPDGQALDLPWRT